MACVQKERGTLIKGSHLREKLSQWVLGVETGMTKLSLKDREQQAKGEQFTLNYVMREAVGRFKHGNKVADDRIYFRIIHL